MYQKLTAKHAAATWLSVAMALLILLVALPVLHFSVNHQELEILRWEMLGICVAIAAVATVAFGWLARHQRAPWLEVILIWLAMASWLQPQWFQWTGPLLDGATIDDSVFFADLVGETVLWVGTLVALVLIAHRFGRPGLARAAFIAGAVALTTAGSGLIGIQESAKKDRLEFGIDEQAALSLSSTRNYFLIVIDESQASIARALVDEHPDIAERFKDFVFFDDFAGGYNLTMATFPLLVSGQFYSNDVEYGEYATAAYTREDALYNRVRDQGYMVNVLPGSPNTFFSELRVHDNLASPGYGRLVKSLTSLLNLSLFSSAPGPVKKLIYADGTWLVRGSMADGLAKGTSLPADFPPGPGDQDTRWFKDFVTRAQAVDEKPRFFSVHFHGAHAPWVLDSDGYTMPSRFTLAGYKDQFRYKLKLIGAFMDRLKSLGLYDDSAIVLVGDHGSGRTEEFVETKGRNAFPPFQAKARANPLMMSKAFGAKHDTIAFNPARLSYRSFHRDIDAMVTDPQTLQGRADTARRFVWYTYIKGQRTHLDGYSEYLIAGEMHNDSAWWPLHRHRAGFPEREQCLFPTGQEIYRYSRNGVVQLAPASVRVEAPDADVLLLKARIGAPSEVAATGQDGPLHALQILERDLQSDQEQQRSIKAHATRRGVTTLVLDLAARSEGAFELDLSSADEFELLDAMLLERVP